jgi:hypothetical protein
LDENSVKQYKKPDYVPPKHASSYSFQSFTFVISNDLPTISSSTHINMPTTKKEYSKAELSLHMTREDGDKPHVRKLKPSKGVKGEAGKNSSTADAANKKFNSHTPANGKKPKST